MSDAIDRAEVLIHNVIFAANSENARTSPSKAARALADAGLLVTPEHDAEVAEQVRAATLAEFTEERTDRMIARRVPCDCPGDWQHHARIVGDDSPATHVRHDVVPSRRLVTPWEPDPRTPEERSSDAIVQLRRRLCEEPEP